MGAMLDLYTGGTYVETPYMNFFEISSKTINNEIVNFNDYINKVTIVVNASPSTINSSESKKKIEILNALKNSSDNLEILVYPTNSIDKSEYYNSQIKEIFESAGFNNGVKLFKKVDIFGTSTCEVYKYLLRNSKLFHIREGKSQHIDSDFNVFIINKEGQVAHYCNEINRELEFNVQNYLREKDAKNIKLRTNFMKLGKFI